MNGNSFICENEGSAQLSSLIRDFFKCLTEVTHLRMDSLGISPFELFMLPECQGDIQI